MADPITAVALGSTVVSGVTGAIGAGQQAGASAASARYQAGVARNNQIIAEQNARRSVQVGRVQSQNQDFKTRQVIGTTEAAQSASGIALDSGSFQQVRDSEKALGRLDASTLVDRAMMQSRSELAQAANFGAEAQLGEMKASSAESAGQLGIASSLLGAAGSFGDKWSRFKTVGLV